MAGTVLLIALYCSLKEKATYLRDIKKSEVSLFFGVYGRDMTIPEDRFISLL